MAKKKSTANKIEVHGIRLERIGFIDPRTLKTAMSSQTPKAKRYTEMAVKGRKRAKSKKSKV